MKKIKDNPNISPHNYQSKTRKADLGYLINQIKSMDRNCEACFIPFHVGQRPLRCARGCGQVSHHKKICNPTKQKQGQWICRSCLPRDINNNSNASLQSFSDTNSQWFQDGRMLRSELVDDFRGHKELQGHYNYLILDAIYDINDFSSFCRSIIYIGKGQRTRYEAHFKNARDGKITHKQEQRILDIWNSGYKPILLKIFKNRSSHEAHTTEAAMIDAIGKDNLSNKNAGSYYGTFLKYKQESFEKCRAVGAWLLYEAYTIFCSIKIIQPKLFGPYTVYLYEAPDDLCYPLSHK